MMNRPLFILTIAIMLFSSFAVTAQFSMPDHTQLGATKDYWVAASPGSGSTYTWKIDQVIRQNGPDNLFSLTWNTEGSFFMEVQEISENNCLGEVKSGWVHVSAVPLLEIIAPPVNVLCALESVPAYPDLSSFLDAGGTVSDNCALDSASFQLSFEEITGLAYPESYIITREYSISDFCGNTSKTRQVITVPGVLGGSIIAQNNVLCFGDHTGSVTITARGGTAPYEYSIGESAPQTSGTFDALPAGTHTINITDSNGCTASLIVTITAEHLLPLAEFTSSYIGPMRYSFIDLSTNAITYYWDFGDGQTSVFTNPTNTFAAAGSYTVVLTASNECGTDSTAHLITIEIPDLDFYTGFSPNDDGINDTWVIPILDYFPVNKVKIINRWGSEVWITDNYNNTNNLWNGMNLNGKDMPDGTYYFIINYGEMEKRGWVFIKR